MDNGHVRDVGAIDGVTVTLRDASQTVVIMRLIALDRQAVTAPGYSRID
jgi:hypothetical protein